MNTSYLFLGFEHITDPNGYDHLLFLAAACAIYLPSDWKRLFWMVTGFTLGHSITLALATLGWVTVRGEVTEFWIPVTIVFTCLTNFWRTTPQAGALAAGRYAMVVFFGLIHGLGFSNYLQSLLGKGTSLFWPLLSFNLGLEVGQLAIVAGVMVFAALLTQGLKVPARYWTWGLSAVVGLLALWLAVDRFEAAWSA